MARRAGSLAMAVLAAAYMAICAAQVQCPSGYSMPPLSGLCYRTIYSPSMAWWTARDLCTNSGGWLASMATATDKVNMLDYGCGGTNPGKAGQWCVWALWAARAEPIVG